jgi:flap endonuclease-1
MGSSAIGKIATRTEIPDQQVSGDTVAVDAFNWIHQYLHTTTQFTDAEEYTDSDGRELPNILCLLRGLPGFFQSDVTPVLVFDGDAHDLKADEQASRREIKQKRAEAAEEARENGEYVLARKLDAQAQNFSPEMIETTKTLCDRLNIPTVVAPAAGEAQAAYMRSASPDVYDHVLSDDYDSILFGSPTTLRNFTGQNNMEIMDLSQTVIDAELSYDQLVDAAILTGTDYNDGVHGIGPVTATKKLKEHGDIFGVLADRGVSIHNVEELRGIFCTPNVTTSYPEPESVTVDVRAGEQYVSNLGIQSGSIENEFSRLQSAL